MSTELMSMALDLGAAENSLEHHGIKGQSWGKRNGPPYPLKAAQLNSDERKENPKGSNEQQKAELKASGKKSLMDRISDKHKQHVIQKKRDEAQKKREATIKAKKQAEIDAANAEKKRKDKLYKYSPEELLEHRLEYSNDELNDAIAKLKQANALQDIAIDTARRENNLFEEQTKQHRRGAERLQTAITYGEKAIKIYNVVATLSGEPTLEKRAEMKIDMLKEEARKKNNAESKKEDKTFVEKRKEKEREKRVNTAYTKLLQAYADKASADDTNPSDPGHKAVANALRDLYSDDPSSKYKDITNDEINEAINKIPPNVINLANNKKK